MNDGRDHREDDIDTGEPIAELAALREDPESGFLNRIRNSIQRRMFASDAMEFSFQALFGTFFEYLGMMFSTLGGGNQAKGDEEK